MLVVLALYHLVRTQATSALPLPSIYRLDSSLEPLSATSCQVLGECRTLSSIIWSCLATILSCTWIAIHPNIPSPDDIWFVRTSRRVGITLMALIAPELVIMWATREWLAARQLRATYRERGFTMTHGFFVVMGGFMMCDGDKPLQVILPENLKKLEDDNIIDFPNIKKEDIEDKSKGDVVSKGLVILQTGWFILQCCARGVKRLPMTELEIVTLAYAAVNLATYSIWWNKPLHVQRPFSIQRKPTSRDRNQERVGTIKATRGAGEQRVAPETSSRYEPLPSDSVDENAAANEKPATVLMYICAFISDLITSFVTVIANAMPQFYVMATGKFGSTYDPLRASSFSEVDINESTPHEASIPAICVAIVFGAIHCIAWSFEFPRCMNSCCGGRPQLRQYAYRCGCLLCSFLLTAAIICVALFSSILCFS